MILGRRLDRLEAAMDANPICVRCLKRHVRTLRDAIQLMDYEESGAELAEPFCDCDPCDGCGGNPSPQLVRLLDDLDAAASEGG